MYHDAVHVLSERLLDHVRRHELLRPGDRIGVAVSGGVDSVALLRLLIELRQELGIVVFVVHFNHKLRGEEAEADQEFVAALAREHGLEFYCSSGNVAQLAAQEHAGVEAAARVLRYEFFRKLLGAVDHFESEESQGVNPGSLGQRNGGAEAAPLQSQTRHGQILQSQTLQTQIDRSPERAATPQSGQHPEVSLDRIATGHTLDDQAETVLLRLIRGTGPRGLGGIYPRVVIENEVENDVEDEVGNENQHSGAEIIRPLLGIRRSELEQYLSEIQQPWREDSSNADSKFTRNRLRGLVMPLLEREFNPAIAESLSELSEIARDEEDYWENEVSGWLGTVVQWSQPEWTRGFPGFGDSPPGSQTLVQISPSPQKAIAPELVARLEESGPAVMNASLSRPWLLTEPRAVQRRVLKAIGDEAGIPLQFKHIEEILRFAEDDGHSGKELSLPLGWKIVREPEAMVFVTPDLRREPRIPDYEYVLATPGRVIVPELGGVIEALRIGLKSEMAEYNPQQLLRANLLPRSLIVRNWRAGDRFWPAHTKAAKKVKELLQPHGEQPRRRLWPVVLNGDEIVWMRGFPVPAAWWAKGDQEAIFIREVPLNHGEI
jgi:tRNA(Ile)-lysidine synthase